MLLQPAPIAKELDGCPPTRSESPKSFFRPHQQRRGAQIHFPRGGVDADSVHAPEVLKVPPAPPSLHITVPVGEDNVPGPVSVTVPVKVIVLPMMTVDGLGDTTALVV